MINDKVKNAIIEELGDLKGRPLTYVESMLVTDALNLHVKTLDTWSKRADTWLTRIFYENFSNKQINK
jgi:hypothetical protein